jgi:hypothetical protein
MIKLTIDGNPQGLKRTGCRMKMRMRRTPHDSLDNSD